MSWQTYFLDVISGREKSLLAMLLRLFLWIPSWIYRAVISARNWAYDNGYLHIHHAPVPLVISIGNIVMGGTGKTPTTLMLAQAFGSEQIAILTRGYRSRAETLSTPVILSRGEGPLYNASYCGDEPYLLARRLPKVAVIVGKDRCAASKLAVNEGARLILLDDGMQHRRMARHLDVVVVDALNPFGHGHLIPRGLLREPVKALSRAHYIVLTHVKDQSHFDAVHQQLVHYTKASMIGTRLEVDKIMHSQQGQIADISKKRVGLFCGIAHPERFLRTVEALGAEVVSHRFFPDHCQFDQTTLERFADLCEEKGAEVLLCTEKDYVKLKGCLIHALPVIWLEMKTEVVAGQENWAALVNYAKSKLD